MKLTYLTHKIIPVTTIAAACFLGASHASAQTLLLRYNFDESSSGTEAANDSGATPAAPGTLEGGATRTSDTPGAFSTGALDTSAVNTYVDAGDVDKLNGLSALTLTAWVKLQGNPAHGNRIMAKQNTASGNFDGFSFAFNNPTSGGITADTFRLNLALGGTGGFSFKASGENLGANNEWVFVAVSFSGGSTIFYSGKESVAVAQLGTSTIVVGPNDPGSLVGHTMPFRVAASSGGTASAPVLIDDARVYSGVLTAEQLDAVRLENLPGANPPNAVLITNPNRSGTTVTFEFQTQAGKSHIVQYKDTLDDASWQELTTIAGDGETELVTDSNATPATRFYQVVTQ